ncbi:SDR family oxidoreductase [Priestia taiwanensis]|uniref:glucose 1-dehydrogenase [NAD(P)(+)] n=1 Tax=Priestia taiwanensis TaxID=1347902 RepID=A0A917ALI1_9BACI|nr:SDR family oxidoreductase [Priestia taiwanensis]MBM7361817.1 NAD(P)-dependent dehydrogenase (short-subunit alcohol dehydrogenase family) [Priestia taiwanensis]GGE57192.1 short-chain dehydrogenase [Priestia taiwanensis]
MSNVENQKLVVITGVTQGLGRAMVDRFSELGWIVAGCGRSVEKIEQIKRELSNKHDFQVVDVSNDQSVHTWSETILQRYGAPDLIINNASIINKNAPIWEVTAKEWETVMNINVNGVVHVIRSFVPAMIKVNRGTIINISSDWGRNGEAMLAPYCASKFAVEGLTQSLALELPKEITVVALDPGGGINTAMLQSSAPEYVGEAPNPESWSKVAVPYMLSLTSEYNGKSLTCPEVR